MTQKETIKKLRAENKEIKVQNKKMYGNLVKTFEIICNDLEYQYSDKRGVPQNGCKYGFIDIRWQGEQKAKRQYEKYCQKLRDAGNEKNIVPFNFQWDNSRIYAWNLQVVETGRGVKKYIEIVDSDGKKKEILNERYLWDLNLYVSNNEDLPVGTRIKIYAPKLIHRFYNKVYEKNGTKFTIKNRNPYYKADESQIIEIIYPKY